MRKSVPVFTKSGELRGIARTGLAASSAATASLAAEERRRKADLAKPQEVYDLPPAGVWGGTLHGIPRHYK